MRFLPDADAAARSSTENARAAVRAAATHHGRLDLESSRASAIFFGDAGRSTHA